MDCIRTGDNLLLNLFSNLQYDIQEKIYHYTLIEKQKDYNRRILYSGKIIHQLKSLIRDHKDYMNEFKEVEIYYDKVTESQLTIAINKNQVTVSQE